MHGQQQSLQARGCSWKLTGQLEMSTPCSLPCQMHMQYMPVPQPLYPDVCTGARVVQLGDLGHGKHGSGGRACFEFARCTLAGAGTGTGAAAQA